MFRFEVLGPGQGTPDQAETINIVQPPVASPPAPPVPQLPSISDLPEPDLGPDFLAAQTVPHNTVPRSHHGEYSMRAIYAEN